MAENTMETQVYSFPDDAETKGKPLEETTEIEIEDDTPPEDRNRKTGEPPEEVTEQELNQYDEKVQKRLKKFTKGYNDERRANDEALRANQ